VSATQFETTPDAVKLTINVRTPRGISPAQVETAATARIRNFEAAHGVKFGLRTHLENALYRDPESPFVQRLLSIYNRVTGESRKPESLSGGTYAKRLPNAVVFGPAMPDEEYLGHRPDENIAISTLRANLEILTETMADFAAG
jgi:acetylornithine deacetylase/succinyl-diaminopimelate desuccinylase-like protein